MPFDKPRTIKLYLHPPRATHLVTLWPDFKVVAKPVLSDFAGPSNGVGVRFLFSPHADAPTG